MANDTLPNATHHHSQTECCLYRWQMAVGVVLGAMTMRKMRITFCTKLYNSAQRRLNAMQ